MLTKCSKARPDWYVCIICIICTISTVIYVLLDDCLTWYSIEGIQIKFVSPYSKGNNSLLDHGKIVLKIQQTCLVMTKSKKEFTRKITYLFFMKSVMISDIFKQLLFHAKKMFISPHVL